MVTVVQHANTTKKTIWKNFEVIFPCRNQCQTYELYIKMRKICSCVQIWQYNYYSKRVLSTKLSFPRCSSFLAGHAFKNLLHQTHVGKCENAVLKSRQNLSSFLSIVGNIFFNLFLVVHLRKKHHFEKEKQYSTQNSMFLEQFYRMSGSRNTLYGKCRNHGSRMFHIFSKDYVLLVFET